MAVYSIIFMAFSVVIVAYVVDNRGIVFELSSPFACRSGGDELPKEAGGWLWHPPRCDICDRQAKHNGSGCDKSHTTCAPNLVSL